MSDQSPPSSSQPLDTVSTAIVERRKFEGGSLSQAFYSTTVQYLLRWSQVSPTQRTTQVLIDPTGGRGGCAPPPAGSPAPRVPHMALLPILEWSQAQSPACNTTTQILAAYESGALAAVFHLPEGQSDQSTIRRTSLANLPIPVLLLTDQAFSIELQKSVTAANLSLTTPNVSDAPTRVMFTVNPRAEVGMSSSSTWTIVGITVGVALGAVMLTSLLMHVQLWRMRRQRARKAFVRAVHDVEERVLAHHHHGESDSDEEADNTGDHVLAKAMLNDLPIKSYTRVRPRAPPASSKRSSLATTAAPSSTHRDSRRFSVYSLLSRLDNTPLAAAPEARAAHDRRVASWLVPNPDDQDLHLLPLSPRMRTSIVSSRSSLDYAQEARARVKENLASPNARARSPLATDRVARDVPPPRRARPVSFHPDTRGGSDENDSAFVVPPMSPTVPLRPTTPTSPTVGHRPPLAHKPQALARGSWASLDAATANPRAILAENLGESKRARPLSMLNPAAASAATPPRRSIDARRASRPVSVIHTLFPLLPGSPYLHAATDPVSAPSTPAAGAAAAAAAVVVNDSCPICVDALVEGDQVRELPCAHVFHVACVDAWLTQEAGECPLCKFDVRGWWEREFGDSEDGEEAEEEEEEEEEEEKPRKGGWFARVLGRKQEGRGDEEQELAPLPKARGQIKVAAKEEVDSELAGNAGDAHAPTTVEEEAAGLGISDVAAVAAEPAPATLDAAPAADEAPVTVTDSATEEQASNK